MGSDTSLRIKRAKVFFVYSFMVTCNDLVPDGATFEYLFTRGKPGSRKNGLSAHFDLDLPIGYSAWGTLHGFIGNIPVTLTPLVRHFSTGCSLTVEVTCEASTGGYLGDQFVYELQHLTSLENNSRAKKTIRFENESIHELVPPTRGERRKGMMRPPVVHVSGQTSVYQVFEKTLSAKEARWNELDGPSEKRMVIRTLPKRRDQLAASAEAQTPWVVTVLELDNGPALDAFCGSFDKGPKHSLEQRRGQKREAIRCYESIFAPILYRSPDKEIGWTPEPSYGFSPIVQNYHLDNMYLLSSLFLQMSRRSILMITKNAKSRPTKYVLPTLLGIAEVTHARWLHLMIVNLDLDEAIRRVSYNNLPPDNKYKLILSLMNHVARSLEDPSVFHVSGNVLREVSAELRQTFQIDKLTESATQKIKLLEEVHQFSSKKALYSKYF